MFFSKFLYRVLSDAQLYNYFFFSFLTMWNTSARVRENTAEETSVLAPKN